jgi:hypothetical protein
MDKYLKLHLYLTILSTVLWVLALCATVCAYQSHFLGNIIVLTLVSAPTITGACAIIYLWWVWVVDYKKHKNEE